MHKNGIIESHLIENSIHYLNIDFNNGTNAFLTTFKIISVSNNKIIQNTENTMYLYFGLLCKEIVRKQNENAKKGKRKTGLRTTERKSRLI